MRSRCRPGAARCLAAVLFLAAVPGHAAAQTEGRVSVGASVTFISPTDEGVKNTAGVGPLVRLNPRRGWGAAGAFNWFRADLRDPAGGDGEFARLRVRPLMAGIGYTVGDDRTLVTFSIVTGPSFNSAAFEDAFLATQSGTPAITAKNSFALRPGISGTHSVAPRVGITGFAGYLFNRPEVTYRNQAGAELQDRWNADALVLSVGVVYSVF